MPPAAGWASARRTKGTGRRRLAAPAATRPPNRRRLVTEWSRVPRAISASARSSGGAANIEHGQHIDANHVEIVGDIDPLVGHRVVPSARAAHDALHLGSMEEVCRIGTVEARWRNGA